MPYRLGMDIFSSINHYLAKLFFPPACVSCKTEGSFLCNTCIGKISLMKNTRRDNPLKDGLIKAIYTPCDYHSNRPLQKALHGLKYNYYKDVSTPLAEILQKSFRQNPPPFGTHLVPIPLHKKREAFRGFNQAELLANHLSELTKYPVSNVLKRKIDTASQATLNREQRLENMKNAFEIDLENAPPKNTPIMLVDDVCTTLSTFKSAAQTLQKHGYRIILCTALAQA
jgi:ComF family protein